MYDDDSPQASTSSSTLDPKPKKFPACDRCKAARVLCLGREAAGNAAHDQGCPRCVSKKLQCTTSPVIRRRRGPRQLQLTVGTKHPGSARPPGSAGYSQVADQPLVLHLPISTVRNLFADIQELPQYNHPLLPISTLLSELDRVSFRLELLPSSLRVFAYAAMAIIALTTSDPFVLGETSGVAVPTGGEFEGADLRAFGISRAHMCSLLRKHAVELAKEEDVMVVCSKENAATCILLDYLGLCDTASSNSSRPYASCAMSHLRVLADQWEGPSDFQDLRWCGFLMAEAITAVSHGSPQSFSAHDEVVICGPDPYVSMDQLNLQLQTDWSRPSSVIIGSLLPFTRNLTALARNISEGIVNGHARRQPINFAHFNSALSVLSTTRATLDLLSSHITLAALTPDHISPHLPRMSHTLVVSWATLHLPLYRELRRRMEQALEGGVELDQDEAARTEALSNDVRRATWNAAILLAQAVRDAPRFAFPLTRLEEWTQVVLAEGETAAALGMEQRPTVALFVQALKRAGWSHVDHSGTTETAELHLSVTQALAPNPAPAQVVLPDDTFWDDFIASQQPKEYTSEDMLGGGAAGFGEDGWAVGLMEV